MSNDLMELAKGEEAVLNPDVLSASWRLKPFISIPFRSTFFTKFRLVHLLIIRSCFVHPSIQLYITKKHQGGMFLLLFSMEKNQLRRC